MITQKKIEEWIQEVQGRPASAGLIIEYIAKRLSELTRWNEELLADNIELRSEKRVEEYETRIANLEYQLEMLKRQIGGEIGSLAPIVKTMSVLIYATDGHVLHVEAPIERLEAASTLLCLQGLPGRQEAPVHLLVTNPQEELLFVFDSGRTAAMPVGDLPAVHLSAEGEVETLNWQNAYLVEPRGGEELATVFPIAKMTLYAYCLQVSRRGCVKRMMKASFESHLGKNYIGSGVKQAPDKTCDLTLSSKDDRLVLASREGFLVSLEVDKLPYTVEEVLRLGPTDYLVSAYMAAQKPYLLMVTQAGKVIQRETSWLNTAESFRTRGQAAFSSSRRNAGVRLAGAAAVDENDWGMALSENGKVTIHKMEDLFGTGALWQDDESAGNVAAFYVFQMTNGISKDIQAE